MRNKAFWVGLAPVVAVVVLIAWAVCTPAKAGVLATMPNTGGGQIILLDDKCNNSSMVIVARSPGGYTSAGCWYPRGRYVIAVYNDGVVMTYLVSNFTMARPPVRDNDSR